MVCQTKLLWGIFLLFAASCIQNCVQGDPQVPCFFILGDSLVDSGNNNNLNTKARVNYAPYGIDYPGGTTGRFCNGRTVVDLLAEHLGFDHHIPSFLTAKGSTILQGVNYASGSAGIRDETGQHLGQCISLNKQLKNHQTTISQMAGIMGNNDSVVQHLNKCIYYVGMGSNDYLNNYFMPEHYPTSKNYSLEEYAKVLVDQFSNQIRTLHNCGARKFVLVGLGPMGCTPHAMDTYERNGSICVQNMNQASKLFNKELKSLVDQLNKELTKTQFIYVDSFAMGESHSTSDLIGIKVSITGCCKVRDDGQCIPNQPPCSDRTTHVFWDSFHPTETVNKLTAANIYSSYVLSEIYPFDLLHLAQLDLEK